MWSARSSVRQRQISPRACVAMKLIASGVTNCAAIVRSPSFSRSSSSTTTTNRPARISSIASSTLAKTVLDASTLIAASYRGAGDLLTVRQARRNRPLDVLREDVHLEVDPLARDEPVERRLGDRVRDQRDPEGILVELRDRERDALDRNRPLLDAVAEDLGPRLDDHPKALTLGLDRLNPPDAVDVPLHDVPAHRVACS